ncbi:thiol-disulfide isomerase, partial [Candidatus Sumerlaeota bacterium]|nr:thiol-disulfide isomerase [Candidatus Sumerlaeota bacterium]
MMLLGAVVAAADDNTPEGGGVTYASNVAKILNAHCVTCHRPGQIAPMSLTSYKDVRPWVKSIKKVVTEGTMPPWFADPAQADFANDTRLSGQEIKTLTAWADGGAPLGDAMDLPPVPKFRDDVWKIGKPDAIFKMTQPYTMGDNVDDRYENFTVPTGLGQDKWITQVELRPGNFKIVHHILLFVIPPGGGGMQGVNLPFGGGGDGDILKAVLSGGGFLSKYAPGNNPDVFPAGAGKLIKAGSSLLFQLHYHKEAGAGTAQTDQSSVAVKYASAPVKDPVTTAWIVNPMLAIPPGGENYRSAATFTFSDDGHIYSLFPHMHYRGKAFKFEAIYPDGKRETWAD